MASAKRQSIYIPEKIQEILATYAYGDESSISGTIAAIIDRYRAITADATPELPANEWMAICDVLNGCGMLLAAGGGRHDQAPMAWASIADSEQDGLGKKWNVDCRGLAEKIRMLPLAGRIAVWDVVARFWASEQLNSLPAEDLLIICGAKIQKLAA
jgi:hypothetical protein